MAKSLSREEFLKNLNDSGLFSQQDIGTTLAKLSDPLHADGEAVAQHLIAEGKLTPFQAEAVCTGRLEGLVIGNHEVLERLGEGGMGTVYKARHRRMKRVVAIKVLSRIVGQTEQFLQRFQREVEAVARLSHPNIVMAYDADESAVGHYLVMEFVAGRDLASEVQRSGPMPIHEAIDCIAQAARALEYAHAQGIIHRDIKPANLLRDVNGVVKVADLGLARFNDACDPTSTARSALTQSGTIMGTVDYMPPEQAMGLAGIDHRADIYSLGCTLYFLLAGRPPYQGQSLMATLLKHRDDPIPSLGDAVQGIPTELDVVFRRMMAKAPADRFQTMTDIIRALDGIAANGGEAAPGLSATIMAPVAQVASQTGLTSTASGSDLTMAQVVPSATIDLTPGTAPTRGTPKLLLVEPSRTQSGIIRKYLQGQGVEHIDTVAAGHDALETMRRERPDVILSAMHLPDMTGLQLAQQVRSECKEATPGFVLISSQSEREEAGTLSKCGNAVLLQKPFTPEQLGDALRLVCDPSRHSPKKTPDRSKLRVLIVDDSAAARTHMRNILERLGLTQLLDAPDGAQAVAAVAKQTFDLIVTDYNMPWMDGRGLVGYLRQNTSTAAVPIIMVTTETDPAKLDEVRRLGVTVCDKSFPVEVVRPIIDQLV